MSTASTQVQLRIAPREALSRLLRHPAVTGVGIPDPLGPPTRIVADPPTGEPPATTAGLDPDPDPRFAPGDYELRPYGGQLLLWPVGPRRRLRNQAALLRLRPDGAGTRVDVELRRAAVRWWSRKPARAGASELLFAILDPVRLDTVSDPFRAARA